MEAAEQDTAIRAGGRHRILGLGRHRFWIATLVAERGRGNSRQIVGPASVLRRKLLGRRGRVALVAVALRPAAATWAAAGQAGMPGTSVGWGGRLAEV